MSVASMTGFARGTGQDGALTWTWEVKSVNGRGLDIRCRLPNGMDSLEPEVRRAATQRFKRGSLNLSLQVDRAAGAVRMQVNREALDQLVTVLREVQDEVGGPPPRIDGLLAVRGVVELVDEDATLAAGDGGAAKIVATLCTVLDDLLAARREEGARIAAVLVDQLGEIGRMATKASENAATQPAAMRKRLEEQVAELIDATPQLIEERLAQEVALLLVKADVREEIDRLRAHVEAASGLIEQGGPIGRRLDFLCQEFIREANTLGSKAADMELRGIGLDLKTVIDQFREQVQNVE